MPGGHGEEAEEHIELECLSLGWRKGWSVDPEMVQRICLAVDWSLRGESQDTRRLACWLPDLLLCISATQQYCPGLPGRSLAEICQPLGSPLQSPH